MVALLLLLLGYSTTIKCKPLLADCNRLKTPPSLPTTCSSLFLLEKQKDKKKKTRALKETNTGSRIRHTMGNTLLKPQEAESEEHQQEEEVSNFTCQICFEPMLSNQRFKNGGLCSHPFCSECIGKYIEVQVEGSAGRIACPGLSCKNSLDPLSCRSMISKSLFEKWSDRLCDWMVLGSETSYCPYQDCSALVLNECKDKLKKIACPNCKRRFCFKCQIPWHAGYKCSESGVLRDRNDVLVGELVEGKKWTRCYNCGHAVERVSGCRSIKCKCGVIFCHQCGGRFHFGSCKHKCCGDAFFFICVVALLAAFFYLLFR